MCTCTVLAQIKRDATSPPRPTVPKWSQNICGHQMEPEFVQWGSGRTCLYSWCTSQRFTTFIYHYWLIQTKLTNVSAIWHKTVFGNISGVLCVFSLARVPLANMEQWIQSFSPRDVSDDISSVSHCFLQLRHQYCRGLVRKQRLWQISLSQI